MRSQPIQSQILFEHQAEYGYRGTIECHWYTDRLLGSGVDLGEQCLLAYLARPTRFQAGSWNSSSLRAAIEAGVGKLANSCINQTP
jgi:hypothetical protein